MKKIKALVTGYIEVPTTPVNISEMIVEQNIARENGHKILRSAWGIERRMKIIISHYFFPQQCDRKEAFEANVLESDWCTFSAKRQLLLQILNAGEYLSGEKKGKCENLLSKVMQYRNAFTHGKLLSTKDRIFIQYFKGSPQKKELTDQYWEKVEGDLFECFDILDELAVVIGAQQQRIPIQIMEASN